MKIKNPNLLINTTVICSALLAAALWFFANQSNYQTSYPWYQTTGDWPSEIDAPVPDSVSYLRHQHMRDSIGMTRDLKNGDALLSSSLRVANIIGARSAIYCDTCRSTSWYVNHQIVDEAHQRHYILLPAWGIHNSESDRFTPKYIDFYVKNGHNYLRQNGKDILVKFVYSHIDKCIMIPVSAHMQTIVTVIAWILVIGFLFYFFYLLGCFLNFLVSLSKGNAFTSGNLRRLLTIGISLLAIPFVILFLSLVMRLIFHNYFTSDVILNKNVWKDWWENLLEGAVFLLIYKAFRQGKKLKEEQEFTV